MKNKLFCNVIMINNQLFVVIYFDFFYNTVQCMYLGEQFALI